MKILNLLSIAALITLLGSCTSTEQKTDATKTVAAPLKDSLKIYLEAMKMSTKAYTMIRPGYYDSALARYNQCLAYLNKTLQDDNNKGLSLYSNVLIQANEGMEAIYDSIKQPDNSVKCALECVKWAKLTHDYQQQIKLEIHIAEKLKNYGAMSASDTAKKGSYGRQALQYALAATKVIDSLNMHDMDDSKYEDFRITSKIYALLGNKEQAHIYDKKYRDLYYSIFKKQPE